MEANLATIARAYLPAGTLVSVYLVDLRPDFLLGRASLTVGGWRVIELDERFGLDGFTFFHELAHHALGHVKVEHKVGTLIYKHPSQANLSQVERETIERYIERLENEADAWAASELAKFEGRFGPFSEALGIKQG